MKEHNTRWLVFGNAPTHVTAELIVNIFEWGKGTYNVLTSMPQKPAYMHGVRMDSICYTDQPSFLD